MKYSVITFGCRVNQADSLGFEEELRARGAIAVAPDAADLVIVNTCSVTATADQGARQTIRRIARDNPAARIVVTGCYATRRPNELAALPNVARVIDNDNKPTLIPLISADACGSVRLQPDLTTAERFGDGDGSCGAAIEPGVAGRTAFTLRVQTGCAEPCAYCIIPTTRGAPRSVPPDRVMREVDRIAGAGYKEIALTGVHLGSYGRDLNPPVSLIDLFRALDAWAHHSVRLKPDTTETPDLLFRISSLEPMDCSRAIVDLVASSDSFAPHFHLPLQHASDPVLSAMRRPYTAAYYASLVDMIRTRIPHAAIGSDVIVGFPGESDADFDRLVSYLEGSPLTHVHVFPYSDRPGTAASAMGDRVHGGAIRERARRVREIGRRLMDRFHGAQVGTTQRGLTLEDGTLVATGNYLKVRIPPGSPRNRWVRVRINSSEPMTASVI
ncbi:MAG: tRNA (N(6)-L-threonylcarbamoyladenosine(37)-C(2))-methylthiotransferase MtaB [Acidobacteria bacterium]|nr:MAG: tRNA (N(6)-L-threonylcarbamoyladenosine(37)-C(2))-methylthiotransferase MtaB [Acidobacteriota bacterium]